MPKTHVERSILINKSPQEVFALLNNFEHWQIWSPWMILEKDVKVNVSDDKKYYEWEGDLTGSGNMTVLSEKENEAVYCDLIFLKPWKSKAKVDFQLKAQDGGTVVTWNMYSSLPFFMFFMKSMMEAMIGMDFSRGLLLLKDLAEDQKIHSQLDFQGITKFDGCKYLGVRTACNMDQMAGSMDRDFGQLMKFTEEHGIALTAAPFSIYHKWDMMKKKVQYSACLPIKEIPTNLPLGMIQGEIPATEVHTIVHQGPYRHIGNAWSSQYMRQRAKKFKLNKKLDPFEVYLNNPADTEETELKTVIHFPVK